ncbi:SdpI family protein [Dehalococcoides sp. THU3]|uniref:SdpI family protein n=1 Tax=Dehalococcoides TaxID=61434 RepID=UPI0005B561B6|nr:MULTISPECIES: SdpI family protein [Dehalococcoides]QYY57789.1 SdpI family protein [Dehalococcoides mccartyi]BAQ34975.1 putative membrane protein [Dehalococcoides sp. UCH007]
MHINWKEHRLSLLIILAMFITGLITWPNSPDLLPVHWGIDGTVDRYGGKFEGLLLMPLISLGIFLLLIYLPYLDPRKANYLKFEKVYSMFIRLITVFFGGIYGITILYAYGIVANTSTFILVMVGLLLALLGNMFGKLRPTWFVGIRTAWTLTSDLSWDKTHRLGGKIFVGAGLLMILAGITSFTWLMIASIAGLLLGVIGLFIYSYLIWKKDPAARTSRF